MSKLRPTITVSLILLTILSLVIDVVLIVVLILNVYGSGDGVGNDVYNDVPSSIRPTGCVVGTFTAVYQRQGVNVTIDRVFLCGDNLHYRFTNEAGLRVYNNKQVD